MLNSANHVAEAVAGSRKALISEAITLGENAWKNSFINYNKNYFLGIIYKSKKNQYISKAPVSLRYCREI